MELSGTQKGLGAVNSEAEKKVRGVFGVWRVLQELKKEYPKGTFMLVDSSAPFDILVVDKEGGNIVAVEVKASRPSSRASRKLSHAQRELKDLLASRSDWKAFLDKYVLYGELADGALVKRVS